MSALLDIILGKLQGGNLDELSKSVGADKQATGNALAAALPVLIGALNRNTNDPSGAASLEKALESSDHDGSLLDNLSGFLKQGNTGMGDGILKHILGGKRGNVESGIAKSSGLDADTIGKLLPMLAPLVMSALGKRKRESNLGAGALSDLLSGEERQLEQRAPKSSSFIGGLLDQDSDGDFDLGDVTKGLLGKLF